MEEDNEGEPAAKEGPPLPSAPKEVTKEVTVSEADATSQHHGDGAPEAPPPFAQSCRAPLKLSALATRADSRAGPAAAAPTVVLGLADVTLGSGSGPAKQPGSSSRVSRVRYVRRGVT